MRRSYELYTLHSRNKTITYHVRLYKQPAWNYWIGVFYHWYDIHVENIPGVKLVEGWINRRRLKKGWDDYIPTWANRDIKCCYLLQKNIVELQSFEVTEEQYEKLR